MIIIKQKYFENLYIVVVEIYQFLCNEIYIAIITFILGKTIIFAIISAIFDHFKKYPIYSFKKKLDFWFKKKY